MANGRGDRKRTGNRSLTNHRKNHYINLLQNNFGIGLIISEKDGFSENRPTLGNNSQPETNVAKNTVGDKIGKRRTEEETERLGIEA